jgi:hypothetical protein
LGLQGLKPFCFFWWSYVAAEAATPNSRNSRVVQKGVD